MLRSSFLKCEMPKLSLERALYLAKEAGVFTTKEIQTHFVKSPSFSTLKSPFLLEDFFSSMDRVDPPKRSNVLAKTRKTTAKPAEENASEKDMPPATEITKVIHNALTKAFNPHESFIHNGREFKAVSEGVGTRKRSIAKAVIIRGTGLVRINGEEDIWHRWPLYYNRFDVLQPFLLTKTAGIFDLHISIRGGGPSGQSGAARLAVARALVNACAEVSGDMRNSLCLLEDTRQRVSKMAGKNAAFARDKNKR